MKHPVLTYVALTFAIWRKVRRRHGVLATGLIVGVLWSAWHLNPLAISGSALVTYSFALAAAVWVVVAAVVAVNGGRLGQRRIPIRIAAHERGRAPCGPSWPESARIGPA